MSSEQKVAIITGASQGIGAGLVKAFRDRNYRVVATSRSIEQTGDQDIVAVRGDVGDPATAEAVVGQAISRFGRIDTLVNNAGIFIAKPFTDYTAEDFDTKIATNLAGFFHITQRVATEMLKQGPATSSASPRASSIIRTAVCRPRSPISPRAASTRPPRRWRSNMPRRASA